LSTDWITLVKNAPPESLLKICSAYIDDRDGSIIMAHKEYLLKVENMISHFTIFMGHLDQFQQDTSIMKWNYAFAAASIAWT
jgi:hypothetical protein